MASLDEKLIQVMKLYPNLYNTSSRLHRDSGMRETSWLNVAQELEISVLDAQRRWKNLRDRFTRERRLLLRRQTESDPNSVCRWPLYESMHYYSQYCMLRKKVKKSDETSVKDDPSSDAESTESTEVASHDVLSRMSTPSPELSEVRPSSESSRGGGDKRKASSIAGSSSLELDLLRDLRRLREDDSELFGRHVAATLRSLPMHKSALAKLRIQQLLYEFEVNGE